MAFLSSKTYVEDQRTALNQRAVFADFGLSVTIQMIVDQTNCLKGGERMKKFIISLLTISVLAAIVFGVSRAFFSDTEKSTNNTFTAGKIDLKIDHTRAWYNGKECTNECGGPNLLTNGSFEDNTVTDPTGWDIFPNGTAVGWTVEWAPGQPTTYGGQSQPPTANLELQKSGTLPNTNDIPDSWQAQNGNQYAELDADWNGHTGSLNGEPALIKISQTITTVPGKQYKLSFWHSPRPGTAAGQNAMKVYWNGSLVATVDPGAGGAGTVWTQYSYDVTATGTSTIVAFEGGGAADSLGVFLDNTGLAGCEYVIEGGQCRLWELKDLDPEDFIWKLNDVKPGDGGGDVLSYHVYDNNAWACTFLTKEDLENTIIKPEAIAGDESDPQGELSKYLNVLVWRDDGDGVFEPPTETILKQGLLSSIDYLPLAEPPDPLIASNTKYLGVAWCFGDMTVGEDGLITCSGEGNQNDAQTDILNADLTFYAVQSRNNPDFSCRSLLTPTPEPKVSEE